MIILSLKFDKIGDLNENDAWIIGARLFFPHSSYTLQRHFHIQHILIVLHTVIIQHSCYHRIRLWRVPA